MAVIAYLIVVVMSQFIFPLDSKLSVTLTALISAGVGGAVVCLLYLRMGFGDELLGSRINRIPAILRPKR